MRRCLDCNARFTSPQPACPQCGSVPVLRDGFRAYAPREAPTAGGFRVESFQELARSEAGHFWFRARNDLITWALRRYAEGFRSFLEIGCGTGYVLSGVARAFPGALLHGSEYHVEGLKFAARRLPTVNFMQMDACDIPFESEYDCIGAFDVIEHIDDDRRALAQIFAALKPGGIALLTVPQHEWLWSAFDTYACHCRRYSAATLHARLREAGFRVLRSTSFVTSLLPAIALTRLCRAKPAGAEGGDGALEVNRYVNRVCYGLLSAEAALIRMGLDLPVGGSRLVVASKEAT